MKQTVNLTIEIPFSDWHLASVDSYASQDQLIVISTLIPSNCPIALPGSDCLTMQRDVEVAKQLPVKYYLINETRAHVSASNHSFTEIKSLDEVKEKRVNSSILFANQQTTADTNMATACEVTLRK